MDSSLIGTCIYSSSLDSDIALESVLGAGSFSTVYLGVSEESCHNVYAVKAVSKANLNVRQLDLIRGESALMNRVHDHPHILTLFDTIETASHLFMVTEYCEMDFYEALVEHYPNGFADPNVIKQICQQLLDAVIYCHGKGVYHRDIKPENILVSRDYSIRLADFGLATSDEWSTEFGCGSTRYTSPECISDKKCVGFYSTAANDVWSLGVMIINVLFGRNPWHAATMTDSIYSLYATSCPGILSQQFPSMSVEVEYILSLCFHQDIESRCTVQDLKHMIASVDRFFKKEDTISSPSTASIFATTTTYADYTKQQHHTLASPPPSAAAAASSSSTSSSSSTRKQRLPATPRIDIPSTASCTLPEFPNFIQSPRTRSQRTGFPTSKRERRDSGDFVFPADSGKLSSSSSSSNNFISVNISPRQRRRRTSSSSGSTAATRTRSLSSSSSSSRLSCGAWSFGSEFVVPLKVSASILSSSCSSTSSCTSASTLGSETIDTGPYNNTSDDEGKGERDDHTGSSLHLGNDTSSSHGSSKIWFDDFADGYSSFESSSDSEDIAATSTTFITKKGVTGHKNKSFFTEHRNSLMITLLKRKISKQQLI